MTVASPQGFSSNFKACRAGLLNQVQDFASREVGPETALTQCADEMIKLKPAILTL